MYKRGNKLDEVIFYDTNRYENEKNRIASGGQFF